MVAFLLVPYNYVRFCYLECLIVVSWSVGRIVGWCVGCLVGWLVVSLVCCVVGGFPYLCRCSCMCRVYLWFASIFSWLVPSLVHGLLDSLVQWCVVMLVFCQMYVSFSCTYRALPAVLQVYSRGLLVA